MILQWSILVLIFVQIHASKNRFVRQTTSDTCAHPDLAFCDFIQCENGRCIEDKANSQCYYCQCDVGFTGMLCETAIVEPTGCNSTCENGGQCVQSSGNGFFCLCADGFTGIQCETSVIETHPCVTNSTICQNGGICTQNGDDYLCNCLAGWSGKNCDTQTTITQCTVDTCRGHGTCIEASTQNGPVVLCVCNNPWTGKFCDVNPDDICSTGFCLSGSTCTSVGNVPQCHCPPTHSGVRCETLLGTVSVTTTTTPRPDDACASNPCVNGGSCYSTNNTVICFCRPGWTGPLCDYPSTGVTTTTTPRPNGTCASNPCVNGGSCYTAGNSFLCFCRPGWAGPLCDYPSTGVITTTTTPRPNDACASNPCENGGACYKLGGGGFVCVCTSAFTGPQCTVPRTTTVPTVDPTSITCANQPCQNGGMCYTAGNSYFCFCGSNSGFSGRNCEIPTSNSSADCPLNCSPGRCVRTGGTNQNAYACMCNGTLNPTSCSSK